MFALVLFARVTDRTGKLNHGPQRSQEVYSEDPRLSSALTMGYVTGIQGSTYNATQKDPKYMQAGACCKHYV